MQVLREVFDYPFSRLDPMGAHIDPPSVAVYDTLLIKGHDRRGHAGLARVVDVSDDRLAWTLELRDGARFHSGEVCDARAVVDSLEALRWHVPGDRQLWYWDPVDSVEPVGDRTLRFTLHHPYVRLPALLWGTHTAVFNRASQLAHPDEFGYTICDGTGPFRLEAFADDRIVVRRDESYPELVVPGFPRAGRSVVDRVEWTFVADPHERVESLRSGAVHCAHGIPYADVDGLRQDPRLHVYDEGQASNMYLSLNWERTDLGFDDLDVRRALSLAIDRAALVDRALLGHGRPTWGPLPPGTEHYDPSVDLAGGHDAARSRRELARLGWSEGADGIRSRDGVRLEFECVVQQDPVFETVASLLAQQLRAVGADLRIRAVRPFAEFYDACARGPASSLSKWLWQDPLDALIGFSSSSTAPFPNWSRASVPALDVLYRAWLESETEDDLLRVASDVQHLFAETLPYLPLLSPNDVWAWSDDVAGFHPSPDVLYPLYAGVALTSGEGAR
jgi:peptide/nickel transport system substrate-binding protein